MNEGETDCFGEKARRKAQESWRFMGHLRAFGRGLRSVEMNEGLGQGVYQSCHLTSRKDSR